MPAVDLARYVLAAGSRVSSGQPYFSRNECRRTAGVRTRFARYLPDWLAESSSQKLRTGRSPQAAPHNHSQSCSYHCRIQSGHDTLARTSTLLFKRLHRRTGAFPPVCCTWVEITGTTWAIRHKTPLNLFVMRKADRTRRRTNSFVRFARTSCWLRTRRSNRSYVRKWPLQIWFRTCALWRRSSSPISAVRRLGSSEHGCVKSC